MYARSQQLRESRRLSSRALHQRWCPGSRCARPNSHRLWCRQKECEIVPSTASRFDGLYHRICPGRHFAESTLLLNIASVLHVFDISPPLDDNGSPFVVEHLMSDGFLSLVFPIVPSGCSNQYDGGMQLPGGLPMHYQAPELECCRSDHECAKS